MQRDIRSLTGIRGVAACLVVFYHFTDSGVGPAAMRTAIHHGYLAVDLFFVLSGFVMAMTYGGLFEFAYRPGEHLRFLGKRLGRVYPLYAGVTAALLLFGACGINSDQAAGPLQILANFLMLQAWGLAASMDPPAWSISTEWAAYLLFPLLAQLCLFVRWRWSAGVGLLALLAVGWLALQPDAALHVAYRHGPLDIANGPTPWPLLRCIAGFCLGLLAWRAASLRALQQLLAHGWVAGGLCLAVLGLLAVPRSDVALVALFPVLIASLSLSRGGASALLGARAVHWLGEISYSIYLVHWPLRMVNDPLRTALRHAGVPHSFTAAAVLLIVATLAAATLTYHGIEQPFRRLSRAWIGRARPVLPVGSEPVRASNPV